MCSRRSRRSAPTIRRRSSARSTAAGSTCSRTRASASGAYSNGGAYDVHPYMLINYNGQYADVSTLAHELGHTMQSYFSNKTQPYPLAGYPIFVAEVASTFNESLLIDYMLKTHQGRRHAAVAARQLPGEHQGHGVPADAVRRVRAADARDGRRRAQPITGDALAKLYMDITKKYYGHDQGVCIVDDYIAHEWSYIPHFYRDFYVFQYATSFTASEALAAEGEGGRSPRRRSATWRSCPPADRSTRSTC